MLIKHIESIDEVRNYADGKFHSSSEGTQKNTFEQADANT